MITLKYMDKNISELKAFHLILQNALECCRSKHKPHLNKLIVKTNMLIKTAKSSLAMMKLTGKSSSNFDAHLNQVADLKKDVLQMMAEINKDYGDY